MISVIVPTLNESRGLRVCLESLHVQSLAADQFEIIVVDNGSLDDTVAIAREFTSHVHSFPGMRLGKLRNEGARLACGSTVAFIDADCIADPRWLEGALAALAEGGVAVGNKYDRPSDVRWIEALWLGDVAPGRHRTSELWSGNLIVGRDDFLACGGFDETLVSYEDVDLSRTLGQLGPLFFDDRVRVVHTGGPRSLIDFAQQQLWHGFEEWTMYRRGIARDTFAPAITSLAGYALMLLALLLALLLASLLAPLLPIASLVALLALGTGLVLSATVWRVILHLRSFRSPDARTVLRLGVLNFLCLSSKAAAITLRAFSLHWSGRRKSVSA